MSYNYLPLDRKALSFQQVKNFLDFGQLVSITFDAHERILKCREFLDKKLSESSELYYVINSGSENMQDEAFDINDTAKLQYNLVKSTASASGEEVPVDIVKLMLMLKIKSLSCGYSGVSIETVKRLMDMYNNDVIPVVYTKAINDRSSNVPLGNLSSPLVGLGEVYYKGQKCSSEEVLQKLSWQRLELKSKEGLALTTGTEFTSAYGMYCLKKAGQLIKIGDAIAAISFDAFNCSLAPLHEKIHSIKGFNGQVETADVVRKYLEGSQLTNTENLDNQDPYCFRCIPQVHGATKDTFSYVLSIFLKEINSVTDDPPIFYEDNLIANGGNFHDQPLALALNFFSAAMRALAIISTGRTNKLINGKKGLGVVLKNGSESNDGLKMLQHAANSVISENKSLFEPAVGDGISAYNIEEDQVMAGADAGTKCLQVIQNVERVLAIELIAAAQVVEFRRPLRSSDILEQILMDFHKQVPLNDRTISNNDILKTTAFVSSHAV